MPELESRIKSAPPEQHIAALSDCAKIDKHYSPLIQNNYNKIEDGYRWLGAAGIATCLLSAANEILKNFTDITIDQEAFISAIGGLGIFTGLNMLDMIRLDVKTRFIEFKSNSDKVTVFESHFAEN